MLNADDAHPCCKLLASDAAPLGTADHDRRSRLIEVSKRKVLVELIGPEGLVKSDAIRMGCLWHAARSRIRHPHPPAEELFVILRGRADWLRGDETYAEYGPGTRRHHPSMMQHATRTRDSAFLSIYIWTGDVSI